MQPNIAFLHHLPHTLRTVCKAVVAHRVRICRVLMARPFHYIPIFREKLITAAVAKLSGSEAAPPEGAEDGADEPVDTEVVVEVERRMTMSAATGPGGGGILKEGELCKQGGKTPPPPPSDFHSWTPGTRVRQHSGLATLSCRKSPRLVPQASHAP